MPLTTAQKQQIAQFQSFTGTDKKVAEKQLRSYAWDSQRAVDGYFHAHPPNAAPGSTPSTSSSTMINLNKLFDKYVDSASRDELQITSTQRYLADLSIPLDSPVLLALSTLVNATSLGIIPRAGFVAAWSHHNATTIKAQASLISTLAARSAMTPCSAVLPPSLLATLPGGATASTETFFRRIYKHTFTLALPSDNSNARAVPLAEAVEYWTLLLGPKSPGLSWAGRKYGTPWLSMWTSYLQDKWGKAVNRDLWGQTLLFAEKSVEDEGLGFWNEDAAWPGVVDEFVAMVKEKRKAEGWAGQAVEKDVDGDAKMA